MLNNAVKLMPAIRCPPSTASDQPEEKLICATIGLNNLNALLPFAIDRSNYNVKAPGKSQQWITSHGSIVIDANPLCRNCKSFRFSTRKMIAFEGRMKSLDIHTQSCKMY
jgi:hypothetical protein